MTRPILIAHRGGLERAPENSLAAFAAAIDSAVDGFELDLQLSAGGALVARHDPLQPDTDVADLPTLAEVLRMTALRRPGMRILIDIKGTPWARGRTPQGRALIDRAAPLLRAYPHPDQIVLGSFDWDTLAYARQTLPHLRQAFHTMAVKWLEGLRESQTGVGDPRDYLAYVEAWRQARGAGHEALSTLELFQAGGAAIWSCHHRDLTAPAIARARSLGLSVWTWTVNTEADLRRVLDLGVDAVTTDRPEQILRLFASTEQETAND